MSRVKFGDIVRDVKNNVDRSNNPYEFYVAGDHMDSEDLNIRRRGRFATDDVGPAFVRIFKPGQILYGSRRTYLKKVAVADFAGICANTTFVLESKDANVFEQRLLPFLMLSNAFTEWSISKSKGSTNPYVLFSDLAGFEFNLPPISEQKVLAEKLWAAYGVKQSYLKMIDATDEMVKAQFIQMFGAVEKSNPLSDVIELTFPGEWGEDDNDGTGIKVIRTTNFTNIGKLNMKDVVTRKIDSAKIDKKRLHRGDIILERSGGTNENPVGRVVYFYEEGDYLFNNFTQLLRCKNEYNSIFVFYALFSYYQTNKAILRQMAKKTTGIMNLKMDDYWKIPIPDVDTDRQNEFVDIYNQADKSKAELRKSIEAIDKVIKSLINENL